MTLLNLENSELLLNYLLTFVVGLALAGIVYWILLRIFRRIMKSSNNLAVYRAVKANCSKPALMFFISIILLITYKLKFASTVTEEASDSIRQLLSLVIMFSVGWFLVGIVESVEDYLTGKYDVKARDNLKARKIHTQVRIIKKVAFFIITLVTVSCMIMTFEKARQFGASLLASAGIIGIVMGFAAQRSLGTIVAGLQIAITQPIRIDDVVIVEGEWGNIEDITMTYVVVRIWDKRRLVVPINYFIEKPFQNWTRVSADLIGTIFLHVDYTVPLDELRSYFFSVLEKNDKWDKKVACMQVTACGEKTVELRFLVGAEDAPIAWDLRCEVREELLKYVRNNYSESLPKVRADIQSGLDIKEIRSSMPG